MNPQITPEAVAAARRAVGIPDERFPRSVAIIMDGNGRWARARGLKRTAGHQEGARTVTEIVRESARLGLEALTLYSFSIENWSRPRDEVNMLMHLYAQYLVDERPTVTDYNIRLRHLGRRDGLPSRVTDELDESYRVCAGNTGMHLCLALNYASRAEIADAVRRLAASAAAGKIDPAAIDEATIADALDTAGIPDPDLVIRTSGEMRVSNFLLWQISYAELIVTDVYWPDFSIEEYHKVIRRFADRNRRFGGVDASNT